MPDVDFRSGSGRLVVAPVGFPPCARSCRAHGVGFCACRIRFRPGLPPSLIRPFSASWFPRFPGLRPAAVPRRGIASGKTRRRCAAVLFAGGGVRSRFRASDFRRPGETADFRRPADAPVGGIAVTSVIPWSLRRSFPSAAPSPRRLRRLGILIRASKEETRRRSSVLRVSASGREPSPPLPSA